MVNHKEKGKVVTMRMNEQMVSRFAHRPGESAHTVNTEKVSNKSQGLPYSVLLRRPLQPLSGAWKKDLRGEGEQLVTFLQHHLQCPVQERGDSFSIYSLMLERELKELTS